MDRTRSVVSTCLLALAMAGFILGALPPTAALPITSGSGAPRTELRAREATRRPDAPALDADRALLALPAAPHRTTGAKTRVIRSVVSVRRAEDELAGASARKRESRGESVRRGAATLSLREPEALPRYTGQWLRPLAGKIESYFGPRRHPMSRHTEFHRGIDIPTQHGAMIRAAAGGRVTFAGRRAGYGLTVEIDHGGGLATVYAHCSSISVGKGNVVQAGAQVARAGRTGRATGIHLHFEVLRHGRPVNPLTFIR